MFGKEGLTDAQLKRELENLHEADGVCQDQVACGSYSHQTRHGVELPTGFRDEDVGEPVVAGVEHLNASV